MIGNGLYGKPADPRPGKDRFGDDGAAQQIGDLQAQYRKNGAEGILEGMLHNNSEAPQPLGLGHINIFLAHNLNHIGA
ncbi:hypothetical protein D3C76_1586850 [compost metagenome]